MFYFIYDCIWVHFLQLHGTNVYIGFFPLGHESHTKHVSSSPKQIWPGFTFPQPDLSKILLGLVLLSFHHQHICIYIGFVSFWTCSWLAIVSPNTFLLIYIYIYIYVCTGIGLFSVSLLDANTFWHWFVFPQPGFSKKLVGLHYPQKIYTLLCFSKIIYIYIYIYIYICIYTYICRADVFRS